MKWRPLYWLVAGMKWLIFDSALGRHVGRVMDAAEARRKK